MPANQDFKDIFRILDEEEVEYIIVGAHAVMFYTEPRYTKDIDILVNPTEKNADRVWRALSRFGAPLKEVSPESFTDKKLIYQIGIAPNRIDVLMEILGVDFDSAWRNRQTSTYDGVSINVLSKEDIVKAKTASARPQDLLDLERLK